MNPQDPLNQPQPVTPQAPTSTPELHVPGQAQASQVNPAEIAQQAFQPSVSSAPVGQATMPTPVAAAQAESTFVAAPTTPEAVAAPVAPLAQPTTATTTTPFVSGAVAPVPNPVAAPQPQQGIGVPIAPIVPNTAAPAPVVPTFGAATTQPLPAQPGVGIPGGPQVAPAAPKNKKPFILIGAAIAGILALGVAAFFAYTILFGSNIKLTTYETDDYSILVPEGYEEDDDTASVTFKKGEEDKESGVSVMFAALPSSIDDDQIKEVRESYFDSLDSLESSVVESGQELEDVQLESITYAGSDARKITASVSEDGQKVGDVVMVFFFGDEAYGSVIVFEHAAEPGVIKQADKILDSFTLKD